MDAIDVMESLRVDALRSIAKIAGLPKTIKRKPELIEALNRFMESDPAGFIGRLKTTELNFLAEAVHNDNRVSPVVFSAKYNVSCPEPQPWGKNGSLLDMVITRDRGESDVEVPGTIADMLRPLLNKPASPKPATVARLPESLDRMHTSGPDDPRPIHEFSGERTVFVELRRVLQLIQGGKVRVQAKIGRPTPATERALAASLAVPDFDLEIPESERYGGSLECGPVRAHAWAVLVQQCGWAKISGESLKLTREGQSLLRSPSPEVFRQGIGRMAADDKFDELRRISNIRGQSGNARNSMTEPSERRAAILEGLAEWPPNEWLAIEEAYRFLNACGHTFWVTDNPMSLYFCELRYGYITDDTDIDRQYLRVLLFESLATLGLVDVAYVYPHYLWPELSGAWGTDDMDFCGRYDGLLYVRLNRLGAYCLGASREYTPPIAESRKLFIFLPGYEIAVLDRNQLLPGDVSMLELFSRKMSEDRWEIDQQLVLDYLECGGSVGDLVRFLEENAAGEIPGRIRVFFDDLKSRAGAVVKTVDAWLVEFQEPKVARLVVRDAKTGKLCLPAGERHVAVAKTNERAFRTALKKLGYVVPPQ